MAKRGSGRTIRMLNEAIDQAHRGRYVFVVCAGVHHAEQLTEQTLRLAKGKMAGASRKIYLEDGGQISFESQASDMFHWDSLTFLGTHPSGVVLVDHFAIEFRFSRIIDMLHRWDRAEIEHVF